MDPPPRLTICLAVPWCHAPSPCQPIKHHISIRPSTPPHPTLTTLPCNFKNPPCTQLTSSFIIPSRTEWHIISYRDASRKRGELLTLDLYLFNNIRLAECCCCCCGANCPNFREYPALHCQLCRSSPHSHFFIASSLSLLPKQRSRFPQSCLPVLTSQSKGVSAELHELLLRKLSCGEPKSADRKLLQQ